MQPAENCWTDDVKMTLKVQPAVDYWIVDRKNLGKRLCYLQWPAKQKVKRRNFSKNGEIFWMSNKAIIEFGVRRIWRILKISEGVIHLGLRLLWITPSLICRILHILLSLIQSLLNMIPRTSDITYDHPWTWVVHCLRTRVGGMEAFQRSAFGWQSR